ncbi:multicopper oxidase domain-containing protein [Thermopolyspora sp. NPDC052614]|uniref:multicopper oxidase family protein n=1 Tax=Thermopolyspora sp. NPDC052614 TaxID=3155682 RepID=UPI0034198BA5
MATAGRRRVMRRRRFLAVTGGAALAAAGYGVLAAQTGEAAGQVLTSRLPLPAPFTVPLPIPRTAAPVRPGHYELVQRSATQEIIPGTTTEVWGYDGTFPGPTLDLRRGSPVTVRVRNELPVPTSTHLHGGVTPPGSDGYPTDLVVAATRGFRPPPGHHGTALDLSKWTLHSGARDYAYPVDQRAATLWYHDHRMDFTGPQVWRGLAGFALIRDDEDDALPLPKGDRDIPLMICDRAFEEDGSFRYPSTDPSLLVRPGVDADYMEGVEGDVILVNGAPWPELQVTATRHRLRLLNASNARRYRLALSPGGDFTQIGSDQGLLTAPLRHTTLPISPGERFDVVVDFSAYPIGSTVTLINTLSNDQTRNVMRFRITRSAHDPSSIPHRLSRPDTPPPSRATTTRHLDFRLHNTLWAINGRPYHPGTPLATPRLGTTEIWRFASDFHHPVHIHLAHFQVLSRSGKPPAPSDAGWKDTVDVRPYEVVEALVRFEGHRGRYMLHCHNLEHEDMGMMADFDVI